MHMVSAEVIFKTRGRRSLLDEETLISAEQIEEFLPEPEAIARSAERFRKLGFTVGEPGVTLTLIGEPERFEKVFRIRIRRAKEEQGEVRFHPHGKPVIPRSLTDVVETIVFSEPPDFI